MKKITLPFLGLFLALSLNACKKDDPKAEKELKSLSEASLDGWVRFNGSVYSSSSSETSISLGDTASDAVQRGILSFSISSIPAGATIISAKLRVFQNSSSSGMSYGEPPAISGLGDVLVDHVSYSVFSSNLYDQNTINANIGTLSQSFAANTFKELTVTTQVKEDIAGGRNRTQFRIYHHIETDHDSSEDSDSWNMGESSANKPELIIIYVEK